MNSRKPLLIGLTGFAGVGKDTAANSPVFVGFRRLAFADVVKVEAASRGGSVRINGRWKGLDELLLEHGGWDGAKREFAEVREVLQNVGRELRDSDPLAIVNRTMEQADDARMGGTNVIITDARMAVEQQAISHRGGFLLRLERPGVGPANNDVTETQVGTLTPIVTIINDADEAALARCMATVIDLLNAWVGNASKRDWTLDDMANLAHRTIKASEFAEADAAA